MATKKATKLEASRRLFIERTIAAFGVMLDALGPANEPYLDLEIPMRVAAKQSTKIARGSRTYTDPVIAQNARDIGSQMTRLHPPPLETPMHACGLLAIVHEPWRKGDRLSLRTRPRVRATRPDYDNLAKQIGDVLTEHGYLADDSQIVCGTIVKVRDGTRRITLIVRAILEHKDGK